MIDTSRFIRWKGWTLYRQVEHLTHLAELCRDINPERSRELVAWAKHLREHAGD